MRGKFIVFEGLDGSGKDTLLDKIFPLFYTEGTGSPIFQNKYTQVLRTREPSLQTEPGKILAKKLADCSLENNLETLRLYISDRALHSVEIEDMLKKGVNVLCSRYDLSTYAYQLDVSSFEEIYAQHSYGKSDGALIPDLTIFIDITAEEAIRRIENSGREKEAFEKVVFLRKVRENYLNVIDLLDKKDSRNIAVLDGFRSKQDILDDTIFCIKKLALK